MRGPAEGEDVNCSMGLWFARPPARQPAASGSSLQSSAEHAHGVVQATCCCVLELLLAQHGSWGGSKVWCFLQALLPHNSQLLQGVAIVTRVWPCVTTATPVPCMCALLHAHSVCTGPSRWSCVLHTVLSS